MEKHQVLDEDIEIVKDSGKDNGNDNDNGSGNDKIFYIVYKRRFFVLAWFVIYFMLYIIYVYFYFVNILMSLFLLSNFNKN